MLPRFAGICALALVLAACGGSGTQPKQSLLLAVNAPFSRSPYIGDTIAQGASLAVSEINNDGGVPAGKRVYTLRLKRYDNSLSPSVAVANVRRALDDGAAAIIDEGTGTDVSWELAKERGVPICITYQGGMGLIDLEHRPNVFRIAPTDRAIAFRLAEYLVPKHLKVALLHDDTGYGQEGARALDKAFRENPEAIATKLTLSSTSSDLAPELVRARRAGATAIIVWGQPPTIAKAVIAARSAGWDVPFYTPPAGEDPLVRQQLAEHPHWVDGIFFATGRLTAEVGPGPFYVFEGAYERVYGAEPVGVRTSAGKRVIQPPEYAMYSYDFVHVLEAAIRRAGGAGSGHDVVSALNEVTVHGANGDERGFNQHNHEGVVDDDVYFARFHDMTYRPVKDDPLSSTLPVIEQRR